MISNIYTERSVNIVRFTDLDNEILRPEMVMIQLDTRVKPKPIDIGSLCYSDRKKLVAGWDSSKKIKPRPVNLESLKPERREPIRVWLDQVRTSGLSQMSMCNEHQIVRYVFDWADSNGHSCFLKGSEAMNNAYTAFTDHLFHRIHGDESWGPSTASRYQSGFLKIAGLILSKAEVRLMKSSRPIVVVHKRRVHAPSSVEVDEYVGHLISFTRGLMRALMHDDFPLKVPCSDYEVVIYPSNNNSICTPFSTNNLAMFDSKTHEIYSYEDYFSKLKEEGKSPSSKKDYARSLKFYYESNKDKKGSRFRKIWAQKVIRGYASLIQFITGVNATGLVAFEYSNALEVSRDSVKKELISVKLRANGFLEKYPVGGNKGLKILKEYLSFRDWYLDGRNYKYLFFSDIESSGGACKLAPLRADFQSRLYRQLSGRVIPEYIENITPSLARKHKSVILKRMGLTTDETAQSLNHTNKTNDESYSAPSIDEMKGEFSEFWRGVKTASKKIKITKESRASATAVGRCDDFGAPVMISAGTPIKPDCNTQHGCLFCENYTCHADEEDIRKLLCLKYVIEAVRDHAEDFERADFLFRQTSVQVNEILKRVKSIYPELIETIERITKEVYELGLLTPFWESRLDMYEDAGVVL